MTPSELETRLLYRDALMLVIDKPAGIAVHKGPKGGENLEAYFSIFRFGLPRDPALAHRLDRDTSGCLVLGRHHKALEKLGLLFKQGKVDKTYWAIVEKGPPQDEGLIDLPLGRMNPERGWWMKVDPSGQASQTRWKVMGRSLQDGKELCFVALMPLTGRTHQLRVHCAAAGWPIVGDPIYGSAGRGEETRLQLHARSIVVPLYKNKAPVSVEAPPPSHMKAYLEACSIETQAG
jgi:tRNA pseudouridine32 synthase / 23S rRNA pseudouridine746 synthase